MIEILVIVFLLALLAWEHYQNRMERNKLVNALIAKNATELRDLDFVDKVTPPKMEPSPDSNLTPTENLTDEEFVEAIKNG